MKQEDLTGATIDRFAYDTPTYPQEDFYALCDDDKPLILVFLPNYGHPISRVFLTRYLDTLGSLQSARLACVVHSEPQVIAKSIEGEFPFTLICDAGGVLYEYFNVESTTSRFSWSIEAARIFRQAAGDGFRLEKGAPQQLPLTLIVGRGGVILFAHYGQSLTDMPEDCAAMERVCARLLQKVEKAAQEQGDETPEWEEHVAAPAAAPMAAQAITQEPPRPELPLDSGEEEREEPMETALAPIEDEAPARQPAQGGEASPEDPQSWNRLLGMFADGNR